jgi:hypothetical protein
MKRLAFLSLLALTGCVTAEHTRKTANVTGNEVSVTVNNVWNANQAFPLADEHCKKYGKAARPTIAKEYAYTFDCVVP